MAARRPPKKKALLEDGAIYRDVRFRFGDRVRIVKRAGTFKPVDTGGPQVEATIPGVGQLLGLREGSLGARGDARFVVRVRWDAQSWLTWPAKESVELGPFTASIHLDYLAVEQAP